MALDGMPTAPLLNLYLAVELGAGALGLWLLCSTG